MRLCRSIACLILTIALAGSSVARQEPIAFVGVKYLKAAEKNEAQAVDCVLEIVKETGELRLVSQGDELLRMDKSQITHLVYERMTKQRVAPGLLVFWPLPFTKGRKHFLTIQYKDAEGKRDFASLSLDQTDVQEVLDVLEAATGIKIQKVLD
ncbi:MAG: hypothetical protein ACREEM_25285 [Blastocatellia bacterium]